MNEHDLKSESQKYLDEMMKFYSMNKNASVNTQKPSENNSGEPDSKNNNSEDIADEKLNDPESSRSLQEDIADEQQNEPEGSRSVHEDIADEQQNEPESSRSVQEDIADEQRNKPENNSMYFNDANSPMLYDVEGEVKNENILKESAAAPVMPKAAANDETVNLPDNTYNRPDGEEISEAKPSDEKTEPYTEFGFIKVDVRTGENALPVQNASVTIENKKGSKNEIIFSHVTDNSGSIGKIRLPAPPNSKGETPGSYDNYSVYTVSVYSKGFYREISEEVPVFSGITSIQRFDLIPLPFNYDDKGQSIVSNNTEPEI